MKILIWIFAALTIFFFGAAIWVLVTADFTVSEESSESVLNLVDARYVADTVQIAVVSSGIVGISEESLKAVNLSYGDFSADYLTLTHNKKPIALHFDNRDTKNRQLYFYAETSPNSLETDTVFMLTGSLEQLDDASPTMLVRKAPPTGAGSSTGEQVWRWEENRIFLPQTDNPDPWLGPLIFAPDSYALSLDGVQPSENAGGELSVHVWSNNSAENTPDHHLRILHNGTEIGDEWWDGIQAKTFTYTLASEGWNSAENQITFSTPGDTGAAGEAIYIDWAQLRYEGQLKIQPEIQLAFRTAAENIMVESATADTLIFDITDQTTPQLLTDFQFDEEQGTLSFAGSDLASAYVVLTPEGLTRPLLKAIPQWENALSDTQRGADYIAIVPSATFSETLTPLITYRQAQGLVAQTILLDQIYTEFGAGQPSAQAIRDFISYARENWAQSPRFILLVGDASYDVRNYGNSPNQNILPAPLDDTAFAGLIANDLWFVQNEEDIGAAIGRFPVENNTQLRRIITKTIAYEQAQDAPWLQRTLLIADDEQRFNQASDQLSTQLSETGYTNAKLYMTENENINDSIMSILKQGVGILNYMGHGSIRAWGDERVLSVEDAPRLNNKDRAPIFTTFTCLNGYFNHPEEDSLVEHLLWAENGGIVAGIAPSGRSLNSQQQPFAETFYQILLNTPNITLGEALQQAKATKLDDPALDEVIRTFNLLGDPALRVNIPSGD